MNTFKLSSIIAALAAAFAAAPASAEGLPSSKATADVTTLVVCKMSTDTTEGAEAQIPALCSDLYTGATVNTTGAWIPIMSKKMKLSNSQSIFLSPSLVSGLYTRTRTKTTTGGTSTAEAMGGVYLRAVLIPAAGGDPIVAAPISQCAGGVLGCVAPQAGQWGVELDTRVQTLTQALSTCVIDVADFGDNNDGTCTFTSTIDLVLRTTSANTFNFIFPNVGQGTYTIQVSVAVASDANIIGDGSAVGAAAFGLGSMLVESVRLVHDFDF